MATDLREARTTRVELASAQGRNRSKKPTEGRFVLGSSTMDLASLLSVSMGAGF